LIALAWRTASIRTKNHQKESSARPARACGATVINHDPDREEDDGPL